MGNAAPEGGKNAGTLLTTDNGFEKLFIFKGGKEHHSHRKDMSRPFIYLSLKTQYHVAPFSSWYPFLDYFEAHSRHCFISFVNTSLYMPKR